MPPFSFVFNSFPQGVRNANYHTYFNQEDAVAAAKGQVDAEAVKGRSGACFFDFYRCRRGPGCGGLCWQLRAGWRAPSRPDSRQAACDGVSALATSPALLP